jgi:hypothetical protein
MIIYRPRINFIQVAGAKGGAGCLKREAITLSQTDSCQAKVDT